MNSKLSHLSEEQIAELIQKYYETEEPVKNLLEEYQISSPPNGLPSLFPPLIHEDLYCDYCHDQNLVSKRSSRQNSGWNRQIPKCPVCDHSNSENCRCENCKELLLLKAQEIETLKRNYLIKRYEGEYIDLPSPNEITLRDAVFILSLVRHCLSEDFETVEPFNCNQLPLAPLFDFQFDITQHLYSKSFIFISPDSPLEAFIFNEDYTEANRYFPKMVEWVFLPGNNSDEKRDFINHLESIVSSGEWPEHWSGDQDDLWREIAKMECFEYFEYLIVQRDFEVKAFGPKTHTVYETMLRHFSIGQAFNISWQAVRDTTDYIVKEGLPKYRANNMFIGAVQRKADKSMAENWNPKHSRRDFGCPQSVVSSTFFNLFLNMGDSVLETVPPSKTHS